MSLQQQVLSELNACRKNPSGYALKLQKTLNYYNGKIFTMPGSVPIETEEGKENVVDCIGYLKSLKPISQLVYNTSLESAAKDHANDIGPSGATGHIGKNGSQANERVEKYALWEGAFAENIDYGNDKAEDIVISLLVDDGVPERGHRLNILNPDLLNVGVAFASHKDLDYVCVIVFAQVVKEKKIEEKPQIVRPKEKAKEFDPSEFERPGFSKDDIWEMKEAFDVLDVDKSGTIEPQELKNVLEEFGFDAKNTTIFQLISELDTDGSGQIDFGEFLDMVSGKTADENSMEEVRKVFNIFDSDKTGHITLKNLKQISKELGEMLSEETLRNLISKGDSNSDGLVSFEDFYYIMTRTVL